MEREEKPLEVFGLIQELDETFEEYPYLQNVLWFEREVYPNYDPVEAPDAQLRLRCYLKFFDPYIRALPRNARILDVGGGTGRFAIPLLERGFNVTLIDASPLAVEKALENIRKRGLLKQANIIHHDILDPLPFKHSFDAAFCIEVLEYMPKHIRKALENVVNYLKPGGRIFIGVPNLYYHLISTSDYEKFDHYVNALRVEPTLMSVGKSRPRLYFTFPALEYLLEREMGLVIKDYKCLFVLPKPLLIKLQWEPMPPPSEKRFWELQALAEDDYAFPLARLGDVWAVVAEKEEEKHER